MRIGDQVEAGGEMYTLVGVSATGEALLQDPQGRLVETCDVPAEGAA